MITDSPQFVGWIITNQCNFACTHCYALSIARDKPNTLELNRDEIEMACQNIIRSKVMTVYVSGGEPLMSPHCDYIVERLSTKGIRVGISTNGVLLTKERLKQLKEKGLYMVTISIDHPYANEHDRVRQQTGSFESAKRALCYCAELGVKGYISTVITRNNWSVLEDIYALGISCRVKGINFKKIRMVGDLKAQELYYIPNQQEEKYVMDVVRLLKQDNKLAVHLYYNSSPTSDVDDGCPCGRNIITVKPDGSIVPCVYSSFVIGNILNDNLHNLWINNCSLQELRRNDKCVAEMKEINFLGANV